ncbi:hypothetical protein EC973_005885 [Apophysomyces ossiformis]|uniref:phenylalanine 4-monooxygenase n=1 Tax=Apophysomyces ossiformis TaxID=679940 RepID=A0A8H7BH11_9FUNG|nr:hypothetical protein EC973_005885 [Apophysomyces ossiformis]
MYRPPPGPYNASSYGSPVQPGPGGSPWQGPPSVPGSESVSPAAAAWKEHQTAEGRKYWFNTVTRQSTWEKPKELLTPEEKALMNSPWKEYTTPQGKKYYSNSQTKETVWEMPAEYKELTEKAQAAKEKAAQEASKMSAFTAGIEKLSRFEPPPSATLLAQTPAVEFATREEAEKAFNKLLKETGVKPDWTWEQTMRAIITHPLYRALKTLGERKAAFHAFIDKEAKREREQREERETKQRMSFFHMLENTREIKPYTRFRNAAKLLANHPAFTQLKPEKQREIYFEEYVHGLQRREKDRLRELRKSSMERFADLLRNIPEITYKTKWKEAQSIYLRRPEFEDPKAFEGMDSLDFLSVFEEHSRQLWETPLEELNQMIRDGRRKERKAREAFKSLLDELLEKRLINAHTMWKEIYPHIKDDQRYLDLLGVRDSTPLDFLWDLLDTLDEQLYQQKKIIYDKLKQHDFEVTTETSYEEYLAIISQDEQISQKVPEENVKYIFQHLQNKAEHRLKEEKRRQEKKLRKKMDALRHALKRLEPPVSLESEWKDIRPRAETLPEFQDIEDEENRVEAFNKFIKRLKEKQNEQDDDEDEEGIIKEDEDTSYSRHRRSRSRVSKRHSRHSIRRESDRDSDHGFSDEERAKKRRRKRHLPRPDGYDYPVETGHSSAEEGEALDEYVQSTKHLGTSEDGDAQGWMIWCNRRGVDRYASSCWKRDREILDRDVSRKYFKPWLRFVLTIWLYHVTAIDHPSFSDSEYRDRRAAITQIAKQYRVGQTIPSVDYNAFEINTWSNVYCDVKKLYPTHACEEYSKMFDMLEQKGVFSERTIPQLESVSAFLKERTGFTILPVMGFVIPRHFMNALAFRVFCSVQYLRHPARPHFTPEPDICHEMLGHVPMFADPNFADLSQEIGLASLGASDEQIDKLSALYWATAEFGLCRQEGGIRAYGAALLSSSGELEYSLSEQATVQPFDANTIASRKYTGTEYQPVK